MCKLHRRTDEAGGAAGRAAVVIAVRVLVWSSYISVFFCRSRPYKPEIEKALRKRTGKHMTEYVKASMKKRTWFIVHDIYAVWQNLPYRVTKKKSHAQCNTFCLAQSEDCMRYPRGWCKKTKKQKSQFKNFPHVALLVEMRSPRSKKRDYSEP